MLKWNARYVSTCVKPRLTLASTDYSLEDVYGGERTPLIHKGFKLGSEDISLIQEALSRIFKCERLDFKILLSDAFNSREIEIVPRGLKPHPCFMYSLKKMAR